MSDVAPAQAPNRSASGAAQANERPSRLATFAFGLVAVIVSGSVAGIYVGAYWRSAGLLIGPSYWGGYLASLAVALLVGRRWLALGVLAALPIAVPAFFGLAVFSSFPTAP
jgi:hypothetical protein